MGQKTSRFFKLGEATKDTAAIQELIFGKSEPLKIQLIGYGPNTCDELTLDSAFALSKHLNNYAVNWINIENTGDGKGILPIAELFNLHELAVEDALHFHQRSKVDDYKDHLFIVLRIPTGKADSYDTEQLALFLGKNYVISFQEKQGGDCLGVVRDRIKKARGHIRDMGADYLAYAIIDAGVDAFFPLLELLGEKIESLDEIIVQDKTKHATTEIHQLKLEVLALRRSVWPMRETVNMLCRDVYPWISDSTRIYLRDCYDHISRIIDLVEMYRELASDLLNIYLSSVNNRMNETIKVLTIITSLFIPPTFIAGLYGMNFHTERSPWNMPELNWYFGYPLCLLLMGLTSVSMIYFLKKKGWL